MDFKSVMLVFMAMPVWSTSSYAMDTLDDAGLRGVTGQAAFFTSYIPSGGTNPNPDTAFYTVGIQGTLELNANIKHLQLGCGGVKGSGCDIDLEDVRLTGKTPDANGNYSGTDAKLTNPFLQLAIKKPDSLAERQVVGINLGAQAVSALLSIGQNPTPSVPGTPGGTPGGETGINSISGAFMASLSNLQIPLQICTYGDTAGCPGFLNLTLATGNANIANNANQPGGVYSQFVSGSRINSITLGKIDLALSDGLLGILGALVGNIHATVTPQNLIDLHNLDVSSTPDQGLSLSLNSTPIKWSQQGTSGAISWGQTATHVGWWLTVPKVNVGGKDADHPVVTSPVGTNLLGALAALSNLNISSINSGQIPTNNCWNSMKFC